MKEEKIEIMKIIEGFCLQNDLSTYDPYDIWKTWIGLKIKIIYYKRKFIGILPASLITLFDIYINNELRFFYKKQEYPIVRAQAVLTLLNLFKLEPKEKYLKYSEIHLDWLAQNSSKGHSGYCWGINFNWVSKNAIYSKNTPHVTHTPYALEAFITFRNLTDNYKYDNIIQSVYSFLENDLKVQIDTEKELAVSYSPLNEPLVVINANAYVMYMYSLLLKFKSEYRQSIAFKIIRLNNFISKSQNKNGSWEYYYMDNKQNFIDCFHSCFVLKNLIKTNQEFKIKDVNETIEKGYDYIMQNFYDADKKIFKRYTIKDNPSLILYDLYDNAEMLQLSLLMNDLETANNLLKNIKQGFIKNKIIYSVIDIFGIRHNKNTLRWAVLPYLYSLSCYNLK